MSTKSRLIGIAALAFIVFLILSGNIVQFITEVRWFDTLGYTGVYYRSILWEAGIWGSAFLVNGLFLFFNYRLAMRLTRGMQFRDPAGRMQLPEEKFINLIAYGVIGFLSFVSAGAMAPWWQTIARYFNKTSYGEADPLFNKDIGFYFFSLPFFDGLESWMFTLVFSSLILAVAVYILKGAIQLIRGWRNMFTGAVKSHISFLLIMLALIWAFSYYLDRYELLFSDEGVVYGAGFTDTHARLLSYNIMIGVTLLIAVVFTVSLFRPTLYLTGVGVALFIVAAVVATGFYPSIQQKFSVAPNELEKEREYIKFNIEYTRKAYGIDKVKRRKYPVQHNLSAIKMNKFSNTLNNIRLWDWRPLLSTYRQIQEIRLYYRFTDVDIDRYRIKDDYRQVMLSARELEYSQVPEQAQNWVNQRLTYTHGYGAVMSPVNRVTPQGLPEFFIQDIPPVSSIEIKIDQPRIYYGEATRHYVFTGTTTDEFDYPMGDENKYNRYSGEGGVDIPGFLDRLLYAWRFKSMKLLISDYFEENTKIHYDREIRTRVNKIAPFLLYDRDPYITIVDGRLYWIIDAYTTSDRFPYAEPVRDGMNYIRNSVKVVVDAYNGSVDYYIIDESDPIITTWATVFPKLFKTEVPEKFRKHFRYPVDLLQIQTEMYRSYHMSDPGVFYNREDMWRMPEEIYEDRKTRVEPYYVIMRLPDSEKEEFLLITPFTPVNKNNMVAWMSAHSDGDSYGRLTLFEFPKKELIYGPMQIEARIDQHTEISELLTLWSQKGSNVIRGNLMVIPIGQSILYVEPLYLRAEQGQMPELKRVIVAYNNNIVMRNTLEESLRVIFGSPPADPAGGISEGRQNREVIAGAAEAMKLFNASQQAMKSGNWAQYGRLQNQLRKVLEKMAAEAGQ